MSSSAITTQVAQLKAGNIQNQADSSSIYSAGVWSFKNSTAVASVTITDAGNVGIGTASPSFSLGKGLMVNNAGPATLRVNNSTDSVNAEISAYTAASGLLLYTITNHPIAFGTNGTEKMRIDAAGSLIVGPTSGYGGLSLAKTGLLSPGVFLWINATATNQKYASFEYNGNGGSGSITPNGTGNVAFNTGPSDYRLKEQVQELSGGLDKIKTLRPVSFVWKKSGESDIGFIAHEIQAVVPECVNGQKDEVDAEGNPSYQSIFPAPAQMIANLVAAIQELSAKNGEQSSRIEALEARLAALESK